MDKMKMESMSLKKLNIERLEELFPNCITEGKDTEGNVTKKVNFDALRQMFSEDIEHLIRKANIPVTAVLGHSAINVSDFATLQIGDIIRLDKKVDEELDIFVGDIRKFTALPGTAEKNFAVRVTTVIREEQT